MTGNEAEPAEPSTARMIDHWLGGSHHFPVDVAAAQAFEQAYGPVADEFRSLRAFLGRAVQRMTEAGINEFLVVGAGIPTQGNVHQAAPHARVLYIDLDPANVALGQQILAGHPLATYAQGDATDLTSIDPTLLHAALPGWGIEPLGIAFLGLAAFISDEALTTAFAQFHAATVPGSMLTFDFDTEVLAEHPEALAMMGPAFRMREPGRFAPLLGPWDLTADGVQPVGRWGWPADAAPGSVPEVSGGEAFYGGLAVHG